MREQRKRLTGTVTSDKMDKTIVVEVTTTKRHPLYEKVVRQKKEYKAHDEETTARPGDLVINEFLADPPNELAGDANCDGERDGGDDEFIEIVNSSDVTVNLGGIVIADDDDASPRLRFIFPLDAELGAGEAVVIFGGGAPACEAWGDTRIETAELGLNNGGDTIYILGDEGGDLATVTYGAEGGENESLTLDPDVR